MAAKANSKERQIEALEGFCVVVAYVDCTMCKKSTVLDEWNTEEDAYKKGYRVCGAEGDECLCPKCIEKDKKKKNKR